MYSSVALADQGEQVRIHWDPSYGSHHVVSYGSDDLEISVGGLLQVQAGLFAGRESSLLRGAPSPNEGFLLRRARVQLQGRFFKWIEAGVVVSPLQDPDTRSTLVEAHVDLVPSRYLGIKTGAIELPWSRSANLDEAAQSGILRPFSVQGMRPGHRLGLLLHSQPWEGRLFIKAGVFNSLQTQRSLGAMSGLAAAGASTRALSISSYTNIHSGYTPLGWNLTNTDGRFVYTGRLDFSPLGALGPQVGDPGCGRLRFNLGGGYFYSDGEALKIHGWTADIHLKWRGVALLAGYLWDSLDAIPGRLVSSPGFTEDLDRRAFYLDGDFTILRHRLALTARFEYIDDDTDNSNDDTRVTPDMDEIVAGGGLTWLSMRSLVKVQVQYLYRYELHGSGLDNDMLLTQVQVAF